MHISKAEINKKGLSGKSVLIAHEVKFVRLLANNDKKVRDKVLKNLKKWLTVRSQSAFVFTELDFMRLWKGLFYCMWLSDKPLIQEELAESISKIVHCFKSMDTALLYTKCTLKSLATEWYGIDRYRIDKFEMLVKRILRQTFEICKLQSWNEQWVIGVGKVLEEILLEQKTSLGLKLYITEVYTEELAKISRGKISEGIVAEFIKPFVIYLASVDDQRQIRQIVTNIFRYMILQSDVGLEYKDKFNAWKQAGFPCKSIDEMQKIELSDDDNSENDEIDDDDDDDDNISEEKEIPLDLRAGKVDVEIPQIPFNPTDIVNLLKEYKFNKSSSTNTRKSMNRLINEFTKLSEGKMPLGIKEIPIPEGTKINAYEAAHKLLNFDQDLYADSSRNKLKRKKKDNAIKYTENFDNINELIVSENHSDATESSSNKRRKLSKENNGRKLNHKIENINKINNKNKLKLSIKKKTKRLNLSEPYTKKTLTRSSKKLNSFAECVEELKTPGIDDSSANNGSTSCNWNVDASITPVLTPVKTVKKKKNPAKKKILLEKKLLDSNVPKCNKPCLTPVLVRLEDENKTPESSNITSSLITKSDPIKKRVKIMLQRNTAQNTSEYIRQIRNSPAIPYDCNRKPKQGVLKPSLFPSPLNPFYKRMKF